MLHEGAIVSLARMVKVSTALGLVLSLSLLFVAAGCEGPAGACESKELKSCFDGKKANCTPDEGKIGNKEAYDKAVKDTVFHEGKKCTDVGFVCTAGGHCEKK